jgi:hypothetical protein
MSPITIYSNEYATLWFHPEHKIVHHKFHKFVYSEAFRNVLSRGLNQMKEQGATKWLSDDRFNSALTPEDGAWAMQEWGPKVIEAGWKAWAIVLPESFLGRVNMKEYIDIYAKQGVTVELFSDPDEALEWLKSLEED